MTANGGGFNRSFKPVDLCILAQGLTRSDIERTSGGCGRTADLHSCGARRSIDRMKRFAKAIFAAVLLGTLGLTLPQNAAIKLMQAHTHRTH